MPELIAENLDPEKEKSLRDWLKRPEAKLLQTVIGAKSRFRMEDALRECARGNGNNSYDLKSKVSMQAAMRYEDALAVLDEIATQAAQYQIVKLKL